jgi:uncharacterized protein with PIN domain
MERLVMAHCSNCGEWILFHHSRCKNCNYNIWQIAADNKNADKDVGRPYQVEEEDVLICAGCGEAIFALLYVQKRNKYYHRGCVK